MLLYKVWRSKYNCIFNDCDFNDVYIQHPQQWLTSTLLELSFLVLQLSVILLTSSSSIFIPVSAIPVVWCHSVRPNNNNNNAHLMLELTSCVRWHLHIFWSVMWSVCRAGRWAHSDSSLMDQSACPDRSSGHSGDNQDINNLLLFWPNHIDIKLSHGVVYTMVIVRILCDMCSCNMTGFHVGLSASSYTMASVHINPYRLITKLLHTCCSLDTACCVGRKLTRK